MKHIKPAIVILFLLYFLLPERKTPSDFAREYLDSLLLSKEHQATLAKLFEDPYWRKSATSTGDGTLGSKRCGKCGCQYCTLIIFGHDVDWGSEPYAGKRVRSVGFCAECGLLEVVDFQH